MEQMVGQTLNRYKINALLGEGGMGAVFKAFDLTLQRDVAVKVMHAQFARQPDFQQRFLQEARTAARLDHPSVVKVFDFGHLNQVLFIVMEFIHGDNLGQMLNDLRQANRWVPLPESVEIVSVLSNALHYLHSQGVLHRDIKPANVMLKSQPTDSLPYRPLLTDLGLAKLLEGAALTADGTSMGTPSYMSPEQALGKPTLPQSDVYSLGILLFELATGKLPFPIKNMSDAIRFHTQTPPPAPRSIRPDLPPSLEQVILKALQKDPHSRFISAADFSAALKSTLPATTAVTSAPTAALAPVSLATQFQNSIAARGQSILAEFPVDNQPSEDRITVLPQGKPPQSLLLKSPATTIGREPSNDIPIDDNLASRHHARIDVSSGSFLVTDLNSKNGTFLASSRLLPGVPEPWTPDKPLRIGNTYFRLSLSQATSQASAAMLAGTYAAPATRGLPQDNMRSSPGSGLIGIFVQSPALSVEPGASTSLSLTILNQSPIVDHFHISIAGIPENWLPSRPQPVQLLPGAQQDLSILIQPPRTPQSRAGTYDLTIRIATQTNPSQPAQAHASLALSSFSRFSIDFHPKKIRTGQSSQLTISNQGNAPDTFSVLLQDDAAELSFSPASMKVSVPENQTAATRFMANPRKRRWIGSQQNHSFGARVTASNGEAQSMSGSATSKAILPPWLIPLLMGLLAVLCVAAIFAYTLFAKSQNEAKALAQAQTQTVDALLSLSQRQTQDAQAAFNQTATAAAATAQAAGDEDGDSLSNTQENTLGTDPNNPDTDADGLMDGEEVNQYGTNPKNMDSDGDTLQDGYEVHTSYTSPTNPDTDGDGTPDAIDSSVGVEPTSAPTELPGDQNGSIGGYVWNDVIPDGSKDSSEDGISGVYMTLTEGECNSGADALSNYSTDYTGTYFFNNLPPGSYCVSINMYYDFNSSILSPGIPSYPPTITGDGILWYQSIYLSEGMHANGIVFGWNFNG